MRGGVRTGFSPLSSLHHNIPHLQCSGLMPDRARLARAGQSHNVDSGESHLWCEDKITTDVDWSPRTRTLTGYMNSPCGEGNTQQLWPNINSVYISYHPISLQSLLSSLTGTTDLCQGLQISLVPVTMYNLMKWWRVLDIRWDQTTLSPPPCVCGWTSVCLAHLSRLAAGTSVVCVGCGKENN